MSEIKAKIEETLSRSVCGGWDRGFLESILEQLAKGRDLSVKQKQTLGKVLARNDKEAQKVHDNWADVYEKESKSKALVLAAYHTHQPYYKPMSADILRGMVPERGKFLRMYDNKYSKKGNTSNKIKVCNSCCRWHTKISLFFFSVAFIKHPKNGIS